MDADIVTAAPSRSLAHTDIDRAADVVPLLYIGKLFVGNETVRLADVRQVKLDASRPVRLTKLATHWHLNPPPKPPLRSFVIKTAKPPEDTQSREDSRAKRGSPQDYGASLLSLYDKDGSGLLEKGEWSQIGEGWDDADQDGDDKLSTEELAWRLAAVAANAGPEREEPATARAQAGPVDDPDTPPRGPSAPAPAPRNRQPENLPPWFLERDTDGDGQVKMCEYARQWTPQLVNQFALYDLNGDGIITPSECLKASAAKVDKTQ